MTVYSCHGAYVFHRGQRSTDLLGAYFRGAGYDFKEHDYIPMGLFMAALFNERIAEKLARKVQPGDVGVGHSSGADVILRAARLGAPFSQLVLINPALDAETVFPRGIDHIHVWHSPSDNPVRIAKYLPFHHWGSMGAVGYTGLDPRVINYDKENDFRVSSDSHSDVFDTDKLAYFGPLIVERVRMHERLG